MGSVGGALSGGLLGGASGYAGGKAQRKAENAYAAEMNSVRNNIRDAYGTAQKGWVDYIPELQQGISGNIGFANQIAGQGSAYNQYLGNEAGQSLGLGYRKATESIAPQLAGETYNLLENFRNETLPGARSTAIDAGAYGGSRDMLTRERLTKNTENQVIAQAAADIANQRAQTPALLGADAASVANYLNTGTAGNNLLVNAANQQQQADMAKTNYLWNLAMDFGNAMGSSQVGKQSSVVPWVQGLQGATQGAGFGMGLFNASQLSPQQFFGDK